jgi:HlyD family secretion protein
MRPPGSSRKDDRPGNAAASGNQGTVYILKNGKLEAVTLTLGITDSRYTEVLAGELKAGDQVITGEAQTSTSAGSGGVRFRPF